MPTILPHAVPPSIAGPVARTVARTGVTPNQVTALGFLLNAIAAVLVGFGMFTAGGIVMLLGSALDMIDGALSLQPFS